MGSWRRPGTDRNDAIEAAELAQRTSRPPTSLGPMWRNDDREILRLAFPAFLTLVAEPLFLMADSAIIGHLGTEPLAGLSIAATILSITVGMCVFLAYGTTSVVSRHLGAGDPRAALTYGVDGLWLAALLGGSLAGLGLPAADHLTGLFDASAPVHLAATTYLRIAILGLPPLLLILAATGVLRGLQDTRTPLRAAVAANVLNVGLNLVFVYGLDLGIAGSAWGTLLCQWGSAAALVGVVVGHARRHEANLRPSRAGIVAAGRAAAPLVIRSLSLQAALTFTTYVVTLLATGHQQAVHLAAHQLTLVIWIFSAYALDAIAIAGQAITGRRLGAGDRDATRAITRRMIGWGVGSGAVLAVLVAMVGPRLTWVFTDEQEVSAQLGDTLLIVALGLPIAGVVFVLDGILIGAGDTRYLAAAQVVALLGYLPLALLAIWRTDSLVALWTAFALGWVAIRCVLLVTRQRSERWLVTGATR